MVTRSALEVFVIHVSLGCFLNQNKSSVIIITRGTKTKSLVVFFSDCNKRRTFQEVILFTPHLTLLTWCTLYGPQYDRWSFTWSSLKMHLRHSMSHRGLTFICRIQGWEMTLVPPLEESAFLSEAFWRKLICYT